MYYEDFECPADLFGAYCGIVLFVLMSTRAKRKKILSTK